MALSNIAISSLSLLLISIETEILKSRGVMLLLSTKIKPMPKRLLMPWMASKLWAAKYKFRSANVTGQDNQLLEGIWVEEDLLQEENAVTDDDLILVLRMESTEDAENIQATEKESTEIAIVNTRKARDAIGIVQDLGRRSTEREETADQILQGNEYWRSDLYTINQWGRFKRSSKFLSTFQMNQIKFVKYINQSPN